jgi:hypothetical protein
MRAHRNTVVERASRLMPEQCEVRVPGAQNRTPMGVTCTLHRVSDAELRRLIDDPDAVAAFLDLADESGPPVVEVRFKGLAGLMLRLFGVRVSEVAAPPPGLEPTIGPGNSEAMLELDKAWHGLHFLLTGTPDAGDEPANFLMEGGEALGDDAGARGLDSGDVRRIAEFLAASNADAVERRYDPARMTKCDVYPKEIWMRPATADFSPGAWLMTSYRELHSFLAAAAAAGDAVIVRVS